MAHRLAFSPRLGMGLAVLTSSILVACSGPSAAPPTSAPATAAPKVAASPAPTNPVASPAVPAASPAAPAASPVAAAASPSASFSGGTRLVFESGASEVRYRARETFANVPGLVEAVGATKAVTGTVVVSTNGVIVPGESKLIVDMSTLTSDRASRDRFIKQNTLQTDQYPNAELILREATGLPNPLPTSGESTFQLLGELTVHGVTRPAQWNVTAQFNPDGVTGTATTGVKITDFGMETPRAGQVLSVEDDLQLELDFRARRG